MSQKYWEEALLDSFDQCGLWETIKNIPREKITEIGRLLQIWHEGIGLVHYSPPNPMIDEIRKLEIALEKERRLKHCFECDGSGRIELGRSNMQCHKCNGAGKL
jgi:hypothetical protein